MIAVEAQFSVETIKKLVDLGCYVNAQNNDGMTCLHSSMWNENREIFKELVSLGANPRLSDCEGDSVIKECATRPLFLALLNESSYLSVSMSETQF